MAEALKRLVGPKALPAAGAGTSSLNSTGFDIATFSGSLLYTVPAGMTTIIRDLKVSNSTATAGWAYLLYGTSSVESALNRFPAPANWQQKATTSPAQAYFGQASFSMFQTSANVTVFWQDTLVLNAGESLWGAANFAGAATINAQSQMSVTIHGVEIS